MSTKSLNNVLNTTSISSTSYETRGGSAPFPRSYCQESTITYPLRSIHPSSDVPRFPYLDPGTKSSEEFAETTKDGSTLADLKLAFHQTNEVFAISMPAFDSSMYRGHKLIKSHILHLHKIKALVNDPRDNSRRLLLFNVKQLNDLPKETREYLEREQEQSRLILTNSKVDTTYSYFNSDEVLSAILPKQLPEGTPTAFTSTGHLAHLNLREEYAAYRYLIGQVILEKNPNIRTVVNKLDTIDNEFRFFKMEKLAGDDEYVVTLSESGCQFTFDFRTVYWNSRLHTEHDRLIRHFQPYEVVSDVMAGVGPFAVPAAKRGTYVLANDLNPSSYEALKNNSQKNRVDSRLRSYCQDGREFIRQSILEVWQSAFPGVPLNEKDRETDRRSTTSRARGKNEHQRLQAIASEQSPAQSSAIGSGLGKNHVSDALQTQSDHAIVRGPSRRLIDHFVMNLPASALEFLDAFPGAYKAIAGEELDKEIERRTFARESVWPMVHVHCFTKNLIHPYEDICARANKALGLSPTSPYRLVPPRSPSPDSRAEKSLALQVKADKQEQDLHEKTDTDDTDALQDISNLNIDKDASPTPELSLHLVRSVAPNKDMYCLSFRLTPAILIGT